MRDLPFLIYQKTAGPCHAGALQELANSGQLPFDLLSRVVTMPHNLGRECSGYVQYIVEHYESLPRMVVFLQFESEVHLPFTGGLWPNLRHLLSTDAGFVGLSKNSFEGPWPHPCERFGERPAFMACHKQYWREASAHGPEAKQWLPESFRFYANGLFAASADRIRAKPLSLYKAWLDRLEGREQLLCVDGNRYKPVSSWANSSSHRRGPAEVDCLMLEKLWHVVFGERVMMPAPHEYARWSAEYVAENARSRAKLRKPATFHCLPNSTWR